MYSNSKLSDRDKMKIIFADLALTFSYFIIANLPTFSPMSGAVTWKM